MHPWLAAAVADLVPALSGAALGVAVRLLTLGARLGVPAGQITDAVDALGAALAGRLQRRER